MALPRLGAVVLALLLLASCSGRQQKEAPKQDTEAKRQALVQCRRYRESLPPLVERYRETESRLKTIEEESFTPALAPLPLDPEEQRLLTIYDQQTEQEQYEQAVKLCVSRRRRRARTRTVRRGRRLLRPRADPARAARGGRRARRRAVRRRVSGAEV